MREKKNLWSKRRVVDDDVETFWVILAIVCVKNEISTASASFLGFCGKANVGILDYIECWFGLWDLV